MENNTAEDPLTISQQRTGDDEDMELLALTIFFRLAAEAVELIEHEENTRLLDHINEQRRMCRNLPIDKNRPTWTTFSYSISETHFRRQFRMSRSAFSHLCTLLSAAASEASFRPEHSLLSTRNAASLQRRGGLISGEVKAAISLRLLAGGSYLDLAPLFSVSGSYIYIIFDEFLQWVLKAFEFPLVKHIQEENWTALQRIAEPFSYASNGVFIGILGPLDGLAVRIQSPHLSEVPDPGNYFCRKGFFALNVQAICDRIKRFTWCYPSNKGSTHDSVAFSNSRLYSLLMEKATILEEKGFYLLGDSAYNLTPFLLVPYSTDDVRNDNSEICDAFNFYLSSSRIFIECAFGELVMRWGILWKTLHFDLAKCQRIVQVCMLLHNFIKDENERDNYDANPVDIDWRPHDNATHLESVSTEHPFPLVADNNELIPRGRPTREQELLRSRGEAIRRSLAVLLQLQGLRRPLHSGMQYNQYGHVFFDG